MIGLPYGEKKKNSNNTLCRFHRIPESNGQTDRQNCNINMLMHDNNPAHYDVVGGKHVKAQLGNIARTFWTKRRSNVMYVVELQYSSADCT